MQGNRSAPGVPHEPLSFWERNYRNPVAHLIAFSTLTVVFVLGSAVAHSWSKDSYKASSETLLLDALKTYRVEARDGRLNLLVDRRAFDSSAQDPGPFGLNNSPAVRGVLVGLEDRTRAFDDGLNRSVRDFFQSFQDQGVPGSASFVKKLDEGSGSKELLLSAKERAQFLEQPETLGEADLIRALRMSRTLESRPDSLPVEPPSEGTEGLARKLREAASKSRRAGGLNQGTWTSFGALGPESVDAHVRTALTPAFLAASIGSPPPNEPSYTALAGTRLTEEMRKDLQGAIAGEHDSVFWLIGYWKWLEIVIWTWFGVLTMAVYDHGTASIRRSGKRVFEPRESWRVLGRLVYAPLLALVFFWLGTSTGLVDAPTFLVDYTLGALAFAFLIGLYPNRVFRLITNAFELALKGGDPEEPPPQGGTIPVPKSPPPPAGHPPKIADLAAKVADTVVAPLRSPNTSP